MLEKIYYTGKKIAGEDLFLLEIVINDNNFSNYIYAYVKAVCSDDRFIITNVEFINNIFNCLYSLNTNNLEEINGDLSKMFLQSIFEFLLKNKENIKENGYIYNIIMEKLKIKDKNNIDDKGRTTIKNDIYTANKIKALDLISEMENKKC